jgi:hypothetical protein
MAWITPGDTPPSFPRQISNSYWKGLRFATEGAYWGIPVAALQAATAQRGEMIPTVVGLSASLAVQPLLSGVAAAGITALVGFPPTAAALAATVLVGFATAELEHKLIHGLTELSREGAVAQRVRFGGGYVDTTTSQQRRQRAAIELAGAMPTSRSWLGQEALFLHK